MTTNIANYKLDGIYNQRQAGFFMQRVKLAAGVISAEQARTVAQVAGQFGRGLIHLTTRGSMEIHWLREGDLANVKRQFAMVGLTSRGACGGAVRGVSCASQSAAGFPQIESLALRLHRYFTANPRFERLPKKFKIGIEANSDGKRHLIQDVGLVLARTEDGRSWYNVWIAGGLGREPRPGFLLTADIAEERIIPLIEAIIRVYSAGTPAGKRLKHLVREIGEDELRRRISSDPGATEELPPVHGMAENSVSANTDPGGRFEARFFAGGVTCEQLKLLAGFADRWADGIMMVTVDQNIAFQLSEGCDPGPAGLALVEAGFADDLPEKRVNFRICPGTHECRAGLAPTRDVARTILGAMGPGAEQAGSWAISGCPNSCTQPQLAETGVAVSRLVKEENGELTPRFDIYRGEDNALGRLVESSVNLNELLALVRQLG